MEREILDEIAAARRRLLEAEVRRELMMEGTNGHMSGYPRHSSVSLEVMAWEMEREKIRGEIIAEMRKDQDENVVPDNMLISDGKPMIKRSAGSAEVDNTKRAKKDDKEEGGGSSSSGSNGGVRYVGGYLYWCDVCKLGGYSMKFYLQHNGKKHHTRPQVKDKEGDTMM